MADKNQKKEFDPKAAAEARKQEMDQITAKLEQGVKDVFESDEYKKLLNVMAKMPHYSINNQLLIMMQKPDATMCNSFTGWKKVNRYVKAGEKGLRILAPAPYQMEKEREKIGPDGKVVRDRDGEPVKEKVKVTINAYKAVSTFDLSQTDGEPLPQLGVSELVGNVEGYATLLEAIKDTAPVPIGFEQIASGAKGYYSQTEKRIAIQEGMSELQTVKTAIHELAHAKYHDIDKRNKAEKKTKEQMECEAESISYVCCAHYGLDTSDYSLSYVAGYSSGKETPELKAALQLIKEGACEIMDAIDKRIQELTCERMEANKVADGFVIDQADFDRVTADCPFDDAEVDHPMGYIKIEPPMDAIVKADKPLEVTADMPKFTAPKKEKKPSVKKDLAEKKAKADKTPGKPKKENSKVMGEAI